MRIGCLKERFSAVGRAALRIGALRGLPFFLALKAEALRLADCIFEALEAVREAEELVERSEERLWRADLHRLRAMLLTATAADKTKIEASFSEAIRAAKRAEVDFIDATRGSKLRRIPSPKGDRFKRTWIPTTSLNEGCVRIGVVLEGIFTFPAV